MSEIKVNRNTGYTVMSNAHLRDKNLSYKAKGLLSVMLSLPEEWDYSINGLAAISKEGVKSIRSTIKELEDAGYIVRTKVNDEKGHFKYIYDIFETPQNQDQKEEQPYTQKGHAVQGHAVQGHAVDGTQINTKELNTKELITKDVKERKSNSYDEIIDSLVTDPKLKEALIEFIKMRKLIKAPLTDHALELLIKKLYRLSSDPQTQIEIIEQSIANSWKGIFELKPVNKATGSKGYSKLTSSREKQYKDFINMVSNVGTKND